MYQWPNDSVYTGYYKLDLKHGYGEYQWAAGKYQGYWEHGKQHGIGCMKMGSEKRNGIWSEGKCSQWLDKE